MKQQYSFFEDPVGRVHILINDNNLVCGIKVDNHIHNYWEGVAVSNCSELLTPSIEILRYIRGDSKILNIVFTVDIDDELIPIYQEIMAIPYGESIDINEFSESIEVDVELVYKAINENPLEIYLPTHRIITDNDTELNKTLRSIEEKYNELS